MNINLNNFSESLLHPKDRFQTLREVVVQKDKQGLPRMFVTNKCVNFEVAIDGKPHILRCVSNSRVNSDDIEESVNYASFIESGYLTSTRFLKNELIVFDNFGEPVLIDIILEAIPDGIKLLNYAESIIYSTESDKIRNLIEECGKLAEWMVQMQFSHGRVALNNIYVSPNGAPILIDYTAVSRQSVVEDIKKIAITAIMLYISVSDVRFFEHLTSHLNSRGEFSQNRDLILEKLTLQNHSKELQKLSAIITDSLSAKESAKAEKNIIDAIKELSQAEFISIPFIKEYLDSIYGSSATRIGVNLAKTTHKQYQFVGVLSDMLMRAWDGKHWSYIDKNRAVVIEGEFISATDFDEGLAVVEIEEGFGLINRDGEFIIPPIYHDIEWNSLGNIVIATKEGLSGIFTREGKAVSGLVYERILDVSEGLLAAKRGKHYGFITREGKTAIPFVYDDAYGFRNGVARVAEKGREFLINSDGEEIEEVNPIQR